MTDELSIVENSEYEHDQFGRVRLVDHRREERRVLLEMVGETEYVTGVGHIPSGVSQTLEEFIEHAEPADISVSPPTVEISAESPDIT